MFVSSLIINSSKLPLIKSLLIRLLVNQLIVSAVRLKMCTHMRQLMLFTAQFVCAKVKKSLQMD